MTKTKIIPKNKCNKTISFGDDYGDNETTFHCQLEKNHKSNHQECGTLYGSKYKVEWCAEEDVKENTIG